MRSYFEYKKDLKVRLRRIAKLGKGERFFVELFELVARSRWTDVSKRPPLKLTVAF
jgi:hypothetical protein